EALFLGDKVVEPHAFGSDDDFSHGLFLLGAACKAAVRCYDARNLSRSTPAGQPWAAVGGNRARTDGPWISHCRSSRRRSAPRSRKSARGSPTNTVSARTATAAFPRIFIAPSPMPAGSGSASRRPMAGRGL